MNRKIFINLPVKDLNRSIEFFKRTGFTINPQFTDETAACVVISDDIYAMILTHEKFKSFTGKEITDSAKASEVIIALSADSKDEVNEMAERAFKAGAGGARPAEDYGFMYGKSFTDPDGHLWEVYWMDPEYINKEQVSTGQEKYDI